MFRSSKIPLLAKDARNGAPGSRGGGRSARPTNLGFAVNLGPPPANADEQESPVAEKVRGLAFKGMADELEEPSDHEQPQRIHPEAMKEKTGDRDCNRNQNCGNAERVADAI